MTANEGTKAWPHSAQLLVAFLLGVISASLAFRFQLARPQPIEPWSTDRRSAPESTGHPPLVSTAHKPAMPSADTSSGHEVWIHRPPPESDVPSHTGKSVPSTLINLARATREELMQLPGVGPVLADRIVRERDKAPFHSVDDLRRVPGIGAKTLAKLRPYVCVDGD